MKKSIKNQKIYTSYWSKKKLKAGLVFLMMNFMTGCAAKNECLCPFFPKPSPKIVQEIDCSKMKETCLWLQELYKLNKKLDLCQP
ncbi:MAG: hypothetical protein EOM53_00520 [Alphaproteobacteria bacterium]|nr:hypothetical protein [Alphaproteobacteria bacterium]